jgi:DNA-binding MarR family transcriptional regulator
MIDNAKKMAQLMPKIMNAFHNFGRESNDDEKLSIRQYQVLLFLHVNKTLSVTQICNKLKLAPSTGTELVNRMIALDYIQKETEKEDQRQLRISLTSKGSELVKAKEESLVRKMNVFLSQFSTDDIDTLVGSFEAIWNVVEKSQKHRDR